MLSFIANLEVTRVTFEEINAIAHSLKRLQYNLVYFEDRRDYRNNKSTTVIVRDVHLFTPNDGVSWNIVACADAIPLNHKSFEDENMVKGAVKKVFSWKLDSWRIGFGVSFLDNVPEVLHDTAVFSQSELLTIRKLRSFTSA